MKSAFIFLICGCLEVNIQLCLYRLLYEISGSKLFYLVVLLGVVFIPKAVLLSKMVILTPHITPVKEERLKKRGQRVHSSFRGGFPSANIALATP